MPLTSEDIKEEILDNVALFLDTSPDLLRVDVEIGQQSESTLDLTVDSRRFRVTVVELDTEN